MKKLSFILMLLFISSSILYAEEPGGVKAVVPREKNVFANPSDNEFIGKIGTGYASDPGKFGLDLSMNYFYNLDPVFVFGFEADCFWVNWNNKLKDVNAGGSAGGSLTAQTDLLAFPVFANAQVRLPFLKPKIYVVPSFTIGLGYSLMVLNYSSDSENGTDLYHGFAWQTFGSIAYKISENSAVDFILDLGYRSLQPEKSGIVVDMSGFFARLGVKMYI